MLLAQKGITHELYEAGKTENKIAVSVRCSLSAIWKTTIIY